MTPSTTEAEVRLAITADDRRIARHAAAAIVLAIAEAAIPTPLPGVKPGLANIVVLIAEPLGVFGIWTRFKQVWRTWPWSRG